MGGLETRERILRAALTRVDRVGLDGLTVREVAGAAGVNLAAINYHFGSKDRLLEEVVERGGREGLWGTLDELRALIEDNRGDIRSGLEEYLSEFLPSLLAHPRRLALRLHGPLRGQEYGGRRVRELNDYLEGFLEVVGPALRPGTADSQRASVTQFWAALLSLGLMPRLFEGFTGPHALEGEGLDRWVARLLDHHLAKPAAP